MKFTKFFNRTNEKISTSALSETEINDLIKKPLSDYTDADFNKLKKVGLKSKVRKYQSIFTSKNKKHEIDESIKSRLEAVLGVKHGRHLPGNDRRVTIPKD